MIWMAAAVAADAVVGGFLNSSLLNKQGKAAKQWGEYQRKLAYEDASREMAAADRDSVKMRRELEALQGSTIAAASASGVTTTSASVMEVYRANTLAGEMDIQERMYQAQVDARSRRISGDSQLYNAELEQMKLKQKGNEAIGKGLTDAAFAIATGGSNSGAGKFKEYSDSALKLLSPGARY
jgi:hypothetical protein